MTKMSTTVALLLAAVIFGGQSLPLELGSSTTSETTNVTLGRHSRESQPNGSLIAAVQIPKSDAADGGERTDGTLTERDASRDCSAAGERWCLQEGRDGASGCRRTGAAQAAPANDTGPSPGNAGRRRRGCCDEEDASAVAVDKGRGLVSEGRGKLKKKKKLKKWAIPLLIAYKLKFFALVPLLISGLVLLVGATGAAGFFFALFAATISLRTHSKW